MDNQRRSRDRRRRVGGSGIWSPASPTSSGAPAGHWYRADRGLWQDAGLTPASANGAAVGRWEDLAASRDHINQLTAANKPSLCLAELNACPVVRFDGSNDYLRGTFVTGGIMAQPNTLFVVARLNPAAVNDDLAHGMVDGDEGTRRMVIETRTSTNPDVWGMHGGSALVSATATDSGWHVWTALYNGASSQLWRDGTSLVAGNAGSHEPDGLTVGASYSGGAAWPGDVAEIVLYNANLSAADRNQVGQYLARRCGLSWHDIT